jgi:hypothetical protein
VNKKLIVGALTGCACLWALPSQADQGTLSFSGTVLPACSFVSFNNTPATGNSGRFTLASNNGSITSVCNTPSTLSITIDKAASLIVGDASAAIELQAAKIRFTGGSGIYANAQTPYQETASFNSQNITSANGDTANLEVDILAPRANSIVVYASLTAQ